MSEIERLKILLAWQCGTISESVASRLIGVDYLALRQLRDAALSDALMLVEKAADDCPYCNGTGKGKMNGVEVGCVMCRKTGKIAA